MVFTSHIFLNIIVFSVDLLNFPDEPEDAITDPTKPLTSRARIEVGYPITDAAKSLNVIRSKEIVEKRINMQVLCTKRFLKPCIVSFYFISY